MYAVLRLFDNYVFARLWKAALPRGAVLAVSDVSRSPMSKEQQAEGLTLLPPSVGRARARARNHTRTRAHACSRLLACLLAFASMSRLLV